jgi:hypothetical protein
MPNGWDKDHAKKDRDGYEKGREGGREDRDQERLTPHPSEPRQRPEKEKKQK